jgi:hypothetical protein
MCIFERLRKSGGAFLQQNEQMDLIEMIEAVSLRT